MEGIPEAGAREGIPEKGREGIPEGGEREYLRGVREKYHRGGHFRLQRGQDGNVGGVQQVGASREYLRGKGRENT
jgi:hypothetical protein